MDGKRTAGTALHFHAAVPAVLMMTFVNLQRIVHRDLYFTMHMAVLELLVHKW